MDWLKLFALLVAVASVQIKADGPKKKIRIHLPQKVKHIHHHKKIYITNHPAPPQYAPAFLPGVKGVALASNAPRPSYVPLHSADLYEEARARLPAVAPAASKLLPLYRARGHYGPTPAATDWDEQDYDLAPPPDPTDVYPPSAYAAPTVVATASSPSSPPKKIKIIKINDFPRKKIVRKVKPKRVILRAKPTPAPPPPPQSQSEDEHPVSSFHEQFYADLEEAGTIRKIKKPPRIEKIIDGDTEHIHTYSEEHIHKVVFDDDSKVTGVVGVDPVGSMSALSAAHPLIPIKNSQTLVAIPTNGFGDLAVMGSMGTPSHLEYASYNPRDVTHDHIFHDHGEIPPGVDITKESFRVPPKVSFTSHGQRINGHSKRYQGKRSHGKPTKPTPDFTYYESIYNNPMYRPKKKLKPTLPTYFDSSPETTQFRPIPTYNFKEKRKTKTRYGYNRPAEFQLQQASAPAPFTVSSTVVHEYAPGAGAHRATPVGFSKYHPVADFRDNYSAEFDYDVFGSSSTINTSEDKTDSSLSLQGKPGKKSVSTQNISFGGQDRQTFVDHMAAAASNGAGVLSEAPAPTAADATAAGDAATPTPYTIKETSPAHSYYAAMALQALHGEQPEASDDHPQYAAPPTSLADPTEPPLATTTSQTLHFYKIQSTDAIPEPEYATETRHGKKRREKTTSRQRYDAMIKELMSDLEQGEQAARAHQKHRGNPKYGDKI